MILLARPGELVAGAEIELAEEEAHHLRVRRADPDQPVRLVDGAGHAATARLRWDGKRLLAMVDTVQQHPRGPALVLGVAAGDKDRFGIVVEKAAELGVTRVVPLVTERGATVASRVQAPQVQKLQRRALEAIKQSGAVWAPEVTPLVALADFASAPRSGARWLGDAAGGAPPGRTAAEPLTVAIGPEGGFTPGERHLLLERGFTPVRLGPEILRFETAAIAAMTAAWLTYPRESHD